MAAAPKQRADLALVERGLAESRTRAQALIMAGLVFSGLLTRRLTPRVLLLVCALVAALRWGITAMTDDPWIIAPLQMLHTFTFGLNLVAMLSFVASRVDPAIGGQAQGMQSTIQQVVTVLTLSGFGWLVGVAGPHAFFASAVMCLVAAGFVLLSLRLKPTMH
jgi:PPP family 3-phenylpropionic acid transporter